METTSDSYSAIAETFKGRTIFITGATGFLGKLTLEKLLRSSPDIRKIYIIVRSKKGKDIATRKKELFDSVVFDTLRNKSIRFEDKVEILPGDLTESNFGMIEEDIKKITDEVDFIFHIAATVRFDEKLRIAVNINIKATKDLLRIAKEMKHLKAFVHVSTAYSHCPRKQIGEEFYESPIAADKLINIVNALDDDMLENILPTLLGPWPNTYVLTKAVAEDVVRNESKGLPITMVRPSIVTSTYSEPLPGWIDNFYGATGVFMRAGLGIVRSVHGNSKYLADVVPADYVANCIIAAAWDLSTNRSPEEVMEEAKRHNIERTQKKNENVPIYNYVSSPEKPLTWRRFKDLSYHYVIQVPSTCSIWYYFFTLNSNVWIHMLYVLFLHTIPAHIVDFGAKCAGKKPVLVQGYQKLNKFLNVIAYFATREWHFKNANTQDLWIKLNLADRKLFPFSAGSINWNEYFEQYIRGARIYLVKDPIETLPQGKSWYWKLKVAHYRLLDVYKKVFKQLTALGYFTRRQWQFENENTRHVWTRIMDTDREAFEFDLNTIDWNHYIMIQGRGMREYVLKIRWKP